MDVCRGSRKDAEAGKSRTGLRGRIGEGRSGRPEGLVFWSWKAGSGAGGWGTLTDAAGRGARSCSAERHLGGQVDVWAWGEARDPTAQRKGGAGGGPRGAACARRAGQEGTEAPGGGSPRDAALRGLRTPQRPERRGRPASPPARARRSGGPASARGCHGDGRAGGDRGLRGKEVSAQPRCGSRGPPGRRGARLCLPRGGPGHGVPRPAPSGPRAGLGAARRRPALTAAPCPAPGGAEAARGRPSTFRMLIKEYHILLPMSLDEYQVAQLYMIQVRPVGSGSRRGPHFVMGSLNGRSAQAAPGTRRRAGSTPPQPGSGAWKDSEPSEDREAPLPMRGGGKGDRRAWWRLPIPQVPGCWLVDAQPASDLL